MAQPILQPLGLLKGNGRLENAIDQIQDQTAKYQETLHLEFCSALGFGKWLAMCLALFARTAPNTLGIPGERTFWQQTSKTNTGKHAIGSMPMKGDIIN